MTMPAPAAGTEVDRVSGLRSEPKALSRSSGAKSHLQVIHLIEDLPTGHQPHLHRGRPRPPSLRRLLLMIHRIFRSWSIANQCRLPIRMSYTRWMTCCLSQNAVQKELHSELKWLSDLPETNIDEHESPLPGEDPLFSQYLRSRSPSYFSVQGIGGNHDSDGGTYSQTVAPGDICLCAEEDPYPADLIDQNTTKPENIPVKTNKPLITLRGSANPNLSPSRRCCYD